jgi:glycosyltransferase involved in cell wall biosynthesis
VAVPFPQVVRRAQALHAREPFDLVVAATGVMAAYALALPGVVRVLEEHNSLTRMLWDRYRAQTSALQRLRCWASWRKAALYEARLFRRFDLVTMVSELDAAGGRGLLPARSPPVEVFANGVDCDAFRPGLAGPQPGRLVFGGALSYQANYEAVEFFLGAVLPQVRARCPGAHLRVTGSTTGADLDGLPLGGAVTLTGFLDDVRPEVAAAWAAVVPILSGGGTRLKVLEAMALGTPVVSTPKGAEGLDVSPEHDILLAEGAAGFAGATVEVLEDPALRRRLAANARRLVERRYDWGAIGRRFRERLEVLVEAAQDREQREA